MCKSLAARDLMHAPDKPSHPFQMIQVVQLKLTPTGRREKGKTILLCVMQRLTVVDAGGNNGNFSVGQFLTELVFFQNLLVCPALGPVEFHNKALLFIANELINAVFIAV